MNLRPMITTHKRKEEKITKLKANNLMSKNEIERKNLKIIKKTKYSQHELT